LQPTRPEKPGIIYKNPMAQAYSYVSFHNLLLQTANLRRFHQPMNAIDVQKFGAFVLSGQKSSFYLIFLFPYFYLLSYQFFNNITIPRKNNTKFPDCLPDDIVLFVKFVFLH
jgi:hypothetical protein